MTVNAPPYGAVVKSMFVTISNEPPCVLASSPPPNPTSSAAVTTAMRPNALIVPLLFARPQRVSRRGLIWTTVQTCEG